MQYAKNIRMSNCIWSHFAVYKPTCFSGCSDPQSFAWVYEQEGQSILQEQLQYGLKVKSKGMPFEMQSFPAHGAMCCSSTYSTYTTMHYRRDCDSYDPNPVVVNIFQSQPSRKIRLVFATPTHLLPPPICLRLFWNYYIKHESCQSHIISQTMWCKKLSPV